MTNIAQPASCWAKRLTSPPVLIWSKLERHDKKNQVNKN
jgi:hypothetical protein